MDATRVSAASAAPAPGLSKIQQQTRRTEVDAGELRQFKAKLDEGWEAARGGHAIQESANSSAVSVTGLQRLRGILERGFASMAGGHRVQQQTYEPEVDRGELTSKIQSMANNVQGFAGGSSIQHEVRNPKLADAFAEQAKSLAKELAASSSGPSRVAARDVQAAGLERAAAERLLR